MFSVKQVCRLSKKPFVQFNEKFYVASLGLANAMLVTPLSIILWRETQMEARFRRAFAWPLPSRPKKLAPLAKKLMSSTCSYVYQV